MNRFLHFILALTFVLFAGKSADGQTPGYLDRSFDPGSNGAWIDCCAVDANGRILIGNGGLERLLEDGTVDSEFPINLSGSAWVTVLRPLADGRILVGGDFQSDDGDNLIRLRLDGGIDETFVGPPYFFNGYSIFAMEVQQTGEILLGGEYFNISGLDSEHDHWPVRGLARILTNGYLDLPFRDAGQWWGRNEVFSIVVQPDDGKIIVGGDFGDLSGMGPATIARVNLDGSVDGSFDPGAGLEGNHLDDDEIGNAMAIDSDGNILVCGTFTKADGQPRPGLARLGRNGNVDTSFAPVLNPGSRVRSFALQPDGKIVIVGDFAEVDNLPRSRIARLKSDGSLDPTFEVGSGANGDVRGVTLQPADGKVLIWGSFTEIDGVSRAGIARLHGGDPNPALLTPVPQGGENNSPFNQVGLLKIAPAGGGDPQFASGIGYGGFTVLTCAHALFDKEQLAAQKNPWTGRVQWAVGRNSHSNPTLLPIGEEVRGYLIHSGYAAAVSADDRTLAHDRDFAVLFHYEETHPPASNVIAAVDGAGNLMSKREKLAIGIPLGIYSWNSTVFLWGEGRGVRTEANLYEMHQTITEDGNYPTKPFQPVGTVELPTTRVFRMKYEMENTLGMSGGPLLVKDGDNYIISGIVTHGNSEVVRPLAGPDIENWDQMGVYALKPEDWAVVGEGLAVKNGDRVSRDFEFAGASPTHIADNQTNLLPVAVGGVDGEVNEVTVTWEISDHPWPQDLEVSLRTGDQTFPIASGAPSGSWTIPSPILISIDEPNEIWMIEVLDRIGTKEIKAAAAQWSLAKTKWSVAKRKLKRLNSAWVKARKAGRGNWKTLKKKATSFQALQKRAYAKGRQRWITDQAAAKFAADRQGVVERASIEITFQKEA